MDNYSAILIGIGNEVLSDDRIGIYLAHRLEKQLDIPSRISPYISLDLLDYVKNKDAVFIIDSFKDPDYRLGGIKVFQLSDLESMQNPSYSHGVTIPIIFNIAEKLHHRVSESIVIFGVNVSDNQTFSEDFSEEIQEIIDEIYKNLEIKIKKYVGGTQ